MIYNYLIKHIYCKYFSKSSIDICGRNSPWFHKKNEHWNLIERKASCVGKSGGYMRKTKHGGRMWWKRYSKTTAFGETDTQTFVILIEIQYFCVKSSCHFLLPFK